MKQIITFALAILFLLWSTSMSGQSLNDAKEFVKWKQTIAMKNHIKNTSDPCFPASSTGPFDPTECIKMQINQIASYKVYAKNNPTITRIINEEVERLLMINKSWSSLAEKEKQVRKQLYLSFLKLVRNNQNDYKKALTVIKNDPSRPQMEIQIAKDFTIWSTWDRCLFILCFQQEGCEISCFFESLFKYVFGSAQIKAND